MIVKIYAQGMILSDELREHTTSKVRLAIGLYVDRIRRADVFVTDVNGPKGGQDTVCKIKLTVMGQSSIIVQETAENIQDAVNVCSHRIKRIAGRQFNRFNKQKVIPLKQTRFFRAQTIDENQNYY